MHFEVEHSTQFATSPCFSSVYAPPLKHVFLTKTNPRGSSDSPLDNKVVEVGTLRGLLLDRTDDGAQVFDVLSSRLASIRVLIIHRMASIIHCIALQSRPGRYRHQIWGADQVTNLADGIG